MTDFAKKIGSFWQDSINALLGLWLIAAPWTLGYTTEFYAAWNAWATGGLITVAAIAALAYYKVWEDWIEVALAAWLIASPWLLGYAHMQWPVWNQVGVGVIAGALALWSAMNDHDQRALSAS